MVMINAFNAFCNWVAASIVSQERIKDRVKIMEFFVQTAKVCALLFDVDERGIAHHLGRSQYLYLLKNFNTLMALLAGLRSESVYRLTYTRAEISRKSEKVPIPRGYGGLMVGSYLHHALDAGESESAYARR